MKEHGVIAIIKKHVLTAIGYMIPLVVVSYRITCNNGNQRTLINP